MKKRLPSLKLSRKLLLRRVVLLEVPRGNGGQKGKKLGGNSLYFFFDRMDYLGDTHKVKGFHILLAISKGRYITRVSNAHISFNKFLCYCPGHLAVAGATQPP